jgi:predicted YcjX-like family ATPase
MARSWGTLLQAGRRHAVNAASDLVDSTLNEQCMRLAVTGLSRAGKTVFITSLIQNLIALGQGHETLPLIARRLNENGHFRLRRVGIVPTGTQTVPYFDFQTKLRGLCQEDAVWPDPTRDIAQVSLALEIERTGIGQKFGNRRIRLDILDYPGEWLLDLPILETGFDDWSAATVERFAQAPLRPCTNRFLEFTRQLVSGTEAGETTVRQGHALYEQSLFQLRESLGLRYLQPGRFLCPGPAGAWRPGGSCRRRTGQAVLARADPLLGDSRLFLGHTILRAAEFPPAPDPGQ